MTAQPISTTPHTTVPGHAPETVLVSCEAQGDHGVHWQILTDDLNTDVPLWLEQSIDDASLPRGLNHALNQNDDDHAPHWLIMGPSGAVQVAQVLDISDGRPTALRTAFPFLDSQRHTAVKIIKIQACSESHEAVLELETTDGATIYAFDALYTVNQPFYQQGTRYQAYLGAFAYELEQVGNDETLLVDDPAAIRHHRALNDILAAHNGVAPDNLQELLDAWQPKSPEDEEPVTLDLSKMVAYLFGEHIGQEDEAWFQGEVLGSQPLTFMSKVGQLLDVVILREPNADPLLIQIAYFPATDAKPIAVGHFVRGNIWLQAALYAA